MHQYKILNYYFYHYQYIIYVIVYIKILPTIHVTIYWYMMEEIRIPIHKQMLQLTYSNTYWRAMQNEIYCNRDINFN